MIGEVFGQERAKRAAKYQQTQWWELLPKIERLVTKQTKYIFSNFNNFYIFFFYIVHHSFILLLANAQPRTAFQETTSCGHCGLFGQGNLLGRIDLPFLQKGPDQSLARDDMGEQRWLPLWRGVHVTMR